MNLWPLTTAENYSEIPSDKRGEQRGRPEEMTPVIADCLAHEGMTKKLSQKLKTKLEQQ